MGANMAEAHPVAFRFVMKAKERGATVIHVDPRFSRTSATADLHVPIRPGSDIAWLGGLIHYVLENDLYFREYVVNYTNAPVIINREFQDTDDLDGLFSGFDPEKRRYDTETWQSEPEPAPPSRRRPGGGILALRGHSSIQGSTDIPTLYNLLPGYMSQPHAKKPHDTLADYMQVEYTPTGWWANLPKYIVSLLKAWYGDRAREENEF